MHAPFDDDSEPVGILTEAGTGTDNTNPTPDEVKNQLASLADAYALPAELVHAVAQTQSGFDTDKVRAKPGATRDALGPENKAYGVMQVSDDQIGKTVRDADGSNFQIGENIKNDWKANAEAGVALLAQHYRLAELEQPFSTMEERAQQTYSGYSAGNMFRDRYLQTLPYKDLPAHPDDRAFLENLHDAPGTSNQETTRQSEAASTSQSSSQSSRTLAPPTSVDASNRIVAGAQKYNDAGSTAWAVDAKKDEFPAGSNKCNKFVGDVVAEAGAKAVVLGKDGKPITIAPGSDVPRPPTAGEWAEASVVIPNWRVLGPNEKVQAGDVAAYTLPGGGGDFTGHSGIVTSVDANGVVHGIAAHYDKVGPDDKFQTPTPTSQHQVTYRRYTGP
jgi:hypothetical protein